MADLATSKFALRQHLLHLGFVFGAAQDVVTERLNSHLGPERAKAYADLLADTSLTGNNRENTIYDFFDDLTSANLLRSLSTDVTLDTCHFLYKKASTRFVPGARILELACWTGGFSSFIAEHHPDCTVTGVDRASKIVGICQRLYSAPNLTFAPWDYCRKKPASVLPADVLLCSLGTNYDCPRESYATFDSMSVRSSSGYRCEKMEARRYFKRWRQAAKPGAALFAVLRLVTFPRFLAFIDAAQEAGWNPLLDDCTAVECAGNKENIPFLAFCAAPSREVHEDVALSHFTRVMNRTDQWATVSGPAAMGVYRSLANRQVLAKKETRDNTGLLIVEEVGVCGSLGYLYQHDTFPRVGLTLLSRSLAENLASSVTQRASEPVAAQ